MEYDLDTSAIGVDGGGTNCRFALVHRGRRHDVRLAAANASTDPIGTITTLRRGLSELAEAANLTHADMAQIPAVLGLAGVMDATMAAQITKDIPLPLAVVGDDRRTAMVGALDGQDGCVIGIGTGSFLGRRSNGRDRLIGGWGFILGDDASGAVLGRQALRCALDVNDGLRQETELTRAIAAKIGSPSAIVAFAATATPGSFAALAPDIVEAAKSGDTIGLNLMHAGAAQIEQGLRQLGWTEECICPIGGLAPHYAPYLPKDMASRLTPPKGTALDGALALAAQIAPVGGLT